MKKIGIIGGSGLDNPNIIQSPEDISIKTPYGKTSSIIKQGIIEGQDVFILARHGRDHSINPSNVNFRANIWALKELGCSYILASTAVGSLRKEIEPGHIILPNQFIDFTKNRNSSYYDKNEVVHTQMADPFCNEMIDLIGEGPRFSTKAESHMFRSWGADIINMSTCPEAALARELGLNYATIAMSTDYDCWKEDEETVSWKLIQKIMSNNSSNVLDIFVNTIPQLKNLG